MKDHIGLAGFGSACALVIFVIACAHAASAATTHSVTEFALPHGHSLPDGIAKGRDGNMWFTEQTGHRIGRIATDGTIAEFTLPHGGNPVGIAAGPDGNMWFTEDPGDRIGRIDMSGRIAEFRLKAGSKPVDVAAGPDGAMWFTEQGANQIGRIDPSGTINEFGVHEGICGFDGWFDAITSDSKYVWFSEPACDSVARMDLRTHYVTQFKFPYGAAPGAVAPGLDGSIWFSELGKIGRIDSAGNVKEFDLRVGSLPASMTLGPDANMWFADYTFRNGSVLVGELGKIDGTGSFSEFPVGSAGGSPTGIALGADGNLWFTEYDGNKIGRLQLPLSAKQH